MLECLRRIDLARSEARLFFWRTNTGAEVDLVVEKHGRIRAAVEIKMSRTVAPGDLRGLRSFGRENPGVPVFVVLPLATPHRVEDVLVTDWRDFLRTFDSILGPGPRTSPPADIRVRG